MRDFIVLALRRWYVVLAAVAVTVWLNHSFMSHPPVVSGKVTLMVLAPPTDDRSTLQQPDAVLVASLAVMDVNDSPHELASSTSLTTLYGRGTTRGTQVLMQHQNNQWRPNVPSPYVTVEATDTSVAAVEARIDEAVARVEASVRALEKEFRIRPKYAVTIVRTPQQVVAVWVPQSGARALVGSAAVGLALMVWGVRAAERHLPRAPFGALRRPPALRAGSPDRE